MSAKNFKFVSPGVFIKEIDNSQLPKTAPAVGPVVIGRFRRGPAFIPTRVESLSELIQIFGEPIRGDEASDVWRGGLPTAPTYGAYAAAAWLKNSAPITVVRILGDQDPSATGVGNATAGWKAGSTPSNQGNPGGAYGLFLINSSSFTEGATGSVDGVLAATWYFDQGGIILSGTLAGGGTTVASGSGILIEEAGTPPNAKFTAQVFHSGSDGEGSPVDIVTFNFDKDSKYYIRKVFNTNPTRTNTALVSNASYTTGSLKPYFLGETFETSVGSLAASTNTYGVILPLGDSEAVRAGQKFKKAASKGQTGWFLSQDIRTTAGSATPGDNQLTPSYDADNPAICPRLFKFHTLSQGAQEQTSYKISIENVKYSRRTDIDPYGSFSVVIRSFYDSDNAPRIVERYDNCNLNPNSANYVARRVGDRYYEWDNSKKRLIEYGTYANNSNILRIEMASEVDLGQASSELLPFGAQGPVKRTGFRLEFNTGSSDDGWSSAKFLTNTSSYGDVDYSLQYLNVRRQYDNSFKWGPGVGAFAAAANKLDTTGVSDLDEFTFNVPAAAGGSATTVRVIVKAALDDPTGDIIHVAKGADDDATADNIILAIVGTADATKARYGSADAGDTSNGVAGLTAVEGSSSTEISLTATTEGSAGNSIAIINVAGLINDSGVSFTGGLDALPDTADRVFLSYAANAEGQGSWLANIKFPDVFLRDSATDGNLSDPTLAYFGFSTTSGSLSTSFEASNLDLLRALPSDYDNFATDEYTERMFIFSLDDLSASSDGQSGTYSYVSGSRAAGNSVTARNGSYKDIIDAGYDRFTVPLFGGFDGLDVTEAEPFNNTRALPADAAASTDAMYYSVKKAIDILADPEFVEMNLVTAPGIRNESLTQHLINVCEDRGDALAIIDPLGGYDPSSERSGTEQDRISATHVSDVVSNMEQRALNSSYGCTYYPWVRINDDIGGGSLWVPPSVAAIGTMAYSDQQKAVWFAPAGFSRGGLSRGAAGFSVTNVRSKLTSAERDDLYEVNINPIASFPSEGIVVFGQKTLQVTPSALDRINVRRLMIFVKKQVSRIAANLLFEQNVDATWDRFKGQVDPFLSNIKTSFGLTDFKVVLDETTTTPELVDRNIMYAKIFLKPARSIEFIAIDFNITNTGASFDD